MNDQPLVPLNTKNLFKIYAEKINSIGVSNDLVIESSNNIQLTSNSIFLHGNLQLDDNNQVDVDNITCRTNITVSNNLISRNITVSNNLIVNNIINASNVTVSNDLVIYNNLILDKDLHINGIINGDIITISRDSIAIGLSAGVTQNLHAIAMGNNAGNKNQGTKAIAIGYYAGEKDQCNNSIILNASDISLNSDFSYALYIAPIRKLNPSIKTPLLQYTNSYEVVESSNINIIYKRNIS